MTSRRWHVVHIYPNMIQLPQCQTFFYDMAKSFHINLLLVQNNHYNSKQTNKQCEFIYALFCTIHRGLVTPNGVSDLSQHWFRYWLVACWTTSHYLLQCWFIANWFQGTIFSEISIKIPKFSLKKENASENVMSKMSAILIDRDKVHWNLHWNTMTLFQEWKYNLENGK